MADRIKELQSGMGVRDFGRLDRGYGSIVGPEMVGVHLMRMVNRSIILEDPKKRKPVARMGGWGVAKDGGRFVVPLPPEYDHNVGLLPHDGKILVTMPGLPTLIADCETGTIRKAT